MNSISAQHILVDHEHEAQDILKKINEGETFEKMAQSFSSCPSGKSGGDLGSFGRGMMVKAFEDAAYALDINQVSGLVKTQFGVHIIKRTA